MSKFFKPEDFPTSSENGVWSLTSEAVAYIANAKLERDGKVVYGYGGVWGEKDAPTIFGETYPKEGFVKVEVMGYQTTHKALLICIEPIEVCKHPMNKIRVDRFVPTNIATFECEECGAKVKPTSFEVYK